MQVKRSRLFAFGERLAVSLTGARVIKLLALGKMLNSADTMLANAVSEALQLWNITDGVSFMSSILLV